MRHIQHALNSEKNNAELTSALNKERTRAAEATQAKDGRIAVLSSQVHALTEENARSIQKSEDRIAELSQKAELEYG